MIDATKIKVGDKVRLRCGETHIVDHYRWRQDHGTDYPVFVNGIAYTAEGFYSTGLTSIYDIVEIIPAETSEKEPIDTTTIKVGDKVRLRNGEVKTVSHVTENTSTYPVIITFDDDLIRNVSYTKAGNWRYGGCYGDFEDLEDILEIIPAEASTSSRDGLGSHSHSFILDKPKEQYVWKATVQYHGSKDGGRPRDINEVHYFTDPICMESLSKLAFDNCGSITVERYELLQNNA